LRYDDAAAPSEEGAVARLRARGTDARRRLATIVEQALDAVFESNFDVRSAWEALELLDAPETRVKESVARRATEWAATRAVVRVGSRFGARVAGRLAVPVGLALEFGFAARDGVRELQVLAGFLVHRLRAAGHPVDRELVRRATLAVYLEPARRPDLRTPVARRALAVARVWSVDAIPLTDRRRQQRTRARVDFIARLDLDVLHHDWVLASAVDVGDVPHRPHPPGELPPGRPD